MMIAFLSFHRTYAATNFTFSPSSVLASGNWVKINISETGIYEIPYSQLREMGFDDPSKVSIFGKGGVSLPINFISGNTRVMTDDLTQTSVWHYDNKLYFYGRGVDEIKFISSSTYFERSNKNIYSDSGAYFITDSREPLLVTTPEIPASSNLCTSGYDYIFHENDLYQNTTQTGQLFWGEDLLNKNEGYEWKYSPHFIDILKSLRLEMKIYAADKSSGTLHYGISEALSGNQTFKVKHPVPASGTKMNPEFKYMTNPILSLTLESPEFTVYSKVEQASGSFINLDYWILSYTKNIPDLSVSPFTQERLTVKSNNSKPGKLALSSAENVIIFDVTDVNNITLLPSEKENEKYNYYYTNSTSARDLIFCDLSKPQKEIKDFQPVMNSDLHAQASEGADFIIISTPQYLPMAERLADLHRNLQNIKVLVTTTTAVYNEFSGGIPDPMAYRALTKLCYQASEKSLKNLLLMGPVTADIRTASQNGDGYEYIIGFQDNKVTTDTEAANVMDFYGFADDNTYASFQNNTVHVGVGLLPFASEGEAELYIAKVERYLTDKDKAAIVNEFLSIGGIGDNHTHDLQSIQISEYWDRYNPDKQLNTVLALDAYKEGESKKKLFSDLRYGKLFSQYFGHGTSRGLNSSYDFFKVNDIEFLNNPHQGFMMICACDLSGTDHGKKGFGELLTLGNANGTVGTIFATRTAWSGQNYELAKQLASSMFAAPEKVTDPIDASITRTVYRTKSPTIGEVFARAKTISNYSNSLTYLLVGDPALTIPVPLRHIKAHAPANAITGQRLKIKGTISAPDSIHLRDTLPPSAYSLPKDERYNGKIVAKIMAPEKTILSNDYLTNTRQNGKQLNVTYNDVRLAEFHSTVKEGEFDFDIIVPEEAALYPGEKIQVFLSAYDHVRDLASSGYLSFILEENPEENPGSFDNMAPHISAEYQPDSKLIDITIKDNGKINLSSFIALLDGTKCNPIKRSDSFDDNLNTFVLFTDNLAKGEHSLKLNVSDVAGNNAIETINFICSDKLSSFELTSDKKFVKDDIEFMVNIPVTKGVLLITDYYDNPVTEIDMNGESQIWDCRDKKGVKVAPGLYKAVVKSPESETDNFSSRLYFAVTE